MNEPKWLQIEEIYAIQASQLALYGGGEGIRDEGLLASALARAQQLFADGDTPDLYSFAAAYAYGIVKNHPFVDGNKRVGFLALYTFLHINGIQVVASESDATIIMLQLAAGELSEQALAAWLRDNTEAA